MESFPFTEDPRPGLGLLLIMGVFTLFFLAGLLVVFIWNILPPYQVWISIVLVFFILILLYGFWMVFNTSYILDRDGITVKFGLATSRYDWNEFSSIRLKQGLFTLKIGWLGVTPCVRLSNAVLLGRMNSRIPLYLTPDDTQEFMQRILHLRPSLGSKAIQ